MGFANGTASLQQPQSRGRLPGPEGSDGHSREMPTHTSHGRGSCPLLPLEAPTHPSPRAGGGEPALTAPPGSPTSGLEGGPLAPGYGSGNKTFVSPQATRHAVRLSALTSTHPQSTETSQRPHGDPLLALGWFEPGTSAQRGEGIGPPLWRAKLRRGGSFSDSERCGQRATAQAAVWQRSYWGGPTAPWRHGQQRSGRGAHCPFPGSLEAPA